MFTKKKIYFPPTDIRKTNQDPRQDTLYSITQKKKIPEDGCTEFTFRLRHTVYITDIQTYTLTQYTYIYIQSAKHILQMEITNDYTCI